MKEQKKREFFKQVALAAIVLSVFSSCLGITFGKNGTNIKSENQLYYSGKPEIEWVNIPEGEHEMLTYKPDTNYPGGIGHSIEAKIHIDNFMMSAHEITNKQYCMFLNQMMEGGGDIRVEESNNNTVVIGSIRGVASSGGLIILKPLTPSYKENLNGSGILYSGGSFKILQGQEEFPVINVTETGAEVFAQFYGLTLPTEAQWEYAASGGQVNPYGTSDGSINMTNANYDNNIGHTQKVMNYLPNGYGLYDMCGNAAEWCISQLRYGGVSKYSISSGDLPKGGSWLSYEDACRIRSKSANDRYFQYPYPKDVKSPYPEELTKTVDPQNNIGFRVVTRVISR
jgi:formylglycine-generating enzyme required for sulfatase activity